MAEAAIAVWPLSLSQRDVWMDQRAWPGSAHLNIGGAAYLCGALDIHRFEQALQLLVQQHEVLRLVPQADGTQRLLPHWQARLERVDVSAAADPHAAMAQWWESAMRQSFDLGHEPPWRAVLLTAHDELHGLFIQFHHVVMDGWGTVCVIRHWSEIYNALCRNGVWGPEPGQAGYFDFVQESLSYQTSDAFARDTRFWRDQWPTLPAPLFERRHWGAGQRGQLPMAHRASLNLDLDRYQTLMKSVQAQGWSSFNLWLAALALYLSRTLQRQELLIGMPTLNRSGRRYRHTPGMFVGVLPLRLVLDGRMTVRELMESTAVVVRSALRHARYPLGELSRELGALRHGREGLLDVLLSFEQQDYSVPFGEAHFDTVRQLFSGQARYPLGVTLCEFHHGQDPLLELEGSSECWSAEEVSALARRLWHVAQVLAHALAQTGPILTLDEVEVLPSVEREQLLHAWQTGGQSLVQVGARAPGGSVTPPTVLDAVVGQVGKRPQAPALFWQGGELSYQDLFLVTRALAEDLRRTGIHRGQVVALALPRSPAWVLSALAVMQAGAVWLPLDLDAPLARMEQLLESSQAVAVWVDVSHAERLAALRRDRHWRVLDSQSDPRLWSGSASSPELEGASWPRAEEAAYVMFTSGSTGQPKGVLVSHAALALRLRWLAREWALGPGDVGGQATQLTFDPSLVEWLLPLTCGAAVALPPPGRLDPQAVALWAWQNGVSFMAFVPSTLAPFAAAWAEMKASLVENSDSRCQAHARLRVACCGGEVLSPALALHWMQSTGAQLYNVYGPTEAVVLATAHRCALQASDEALPIGRPLDDTCAYVLDAQCRLLPVGAVGDLYLGGSTLAMGYLHRPDLTAQAFWEDPFRPGQRIYRTGDRAYWDAQGQLHFAGRDDRQVKLRGYRIELAEVESVVLQATGVTQAVVQRVLRNDVPQLYLWLAGDAVSAFDLTRQVRMLLRERLPDYMQPAGVGVLPQLPLTSHGKVDESRLPLPQWPDSTPSRPPRTTLEQELVTLWAETLGHPVGVDDHFFEQGGDSLAAMGLLAALELRWQRPLHLHHLLEHPTVAELARVLEGQGTSSVRPEVLQWLQHVSADGPAGQTATVCLVASGQGDVLRFQLLARALGPQWAVLMLQPPQDGQERSLSELAGLYVEALSPHLSALVLLGFSIGGVTALETARLLHAQGHAPLGLGLLDTIYPRRIVGGRWLWRWLQWLVRKLGVQDLSLNGRRLKALFEDPGLQMQVSALRQHRVQACKVPTLLLKTRGLRRWDRLLFGPWRGVFEGQLWQELTVPGLHGTLFEARHLGLVAERLRHWMDGLLKESLHDS